MSPVSPERPDGKVNEGRKVGEGVNTLRAAMTASPDAHHPRVPPTLAGVQRPQSAFPHTAIVAKIARNVEERKGRELWRKIYTASGPRLRRQRRRVLLIAMLRLTGWRWRCLEHFKVMC